MSFTSPKVVEDLLNYRLNRLLSSSGAMVTRLCEGRFGITRREWRLICLLAEKGPMSPTQLAQSAHLERAPVSKHIRDLIEKKILKRLRVEGDMRRAVLELTPHGYQIHGELFPQSVQLNQEVLAALSPKALADFDAALTQLTEHADRLLAASPLTEKADRRHGGSRRIR